jgi:phage terminase large subunit
VYTFPNGSYIEFFSADNTSRLRGSSREILFINECNLLKKDAYIQLSMRTTQKVVIDYNPADEFHWIYDDILPREDTLYIHSTYLDNLRFLEKSQIREIEKLKDIDPNYWKIYGLGERGHALEIIYTNYEIVDTWPDSYDVKIYGLDFGFNNPTGLGEIRIKDQIPYIRQRIHESGLTNNDLIERLKLEGIEKNINIYGDSAEPARIEEIRREGYQICPADKSVTDGLDYCKSLSLKIHRDSIDVIKEIRYYKYKIDKKTETATDEPVKFNDHAMDWIRYALYTYYLETQQTFQMRVF